MIVKYLAYCGFSRYRIPTIFIDSMSLLYRLSSYFVQVKVAELVHMTFTGKNTFFSDIRGRSFLPVVLEMVKQYSDGHFLGSVFNGEHARTLHFHQSPASPSF
jgi:hypothetical protein